MSIFKKVLGFSGPGLAIKGIKKIGQNPENSFQTMGQNQMVDSFRQMQGFAAKGPGAEDVGNFTGSQRDLASMLQQYSQGGFMPGQEDISQANTLAGQLFQAQRTAQTQAFQDQMTMANRAAARSGRGVNDPILRNKLAQEQTRQGAMLEAQQGGFAAQYAQSLPGQRLNFAQQRVGVLGDLSNQAYSNQTNLFNTGQAISQQTPQNRGGFLTGLGRVFNAAAGVAKTVTGVMSGNPMAAAGGAGDFGAALSSFGGQPSAGPQAFSLGVQGGGYSGYNFGNSPAPSFGGGSPWSLGVQGGNQSPASGPSLLGGMKF
jgi:hypothetical protein